MKAVVLEGHGGLDKLVFRRDFPTPVPGPGEVLIRTEATGINQVDLVVRRGYPGIPVQLPHIPGGDVAGTVAQVGEGVREWGGGERVVAYPLVQCGECSRCREGRGNLCLNWRYLGLHLNGGYAEYVIVPSRNLVRLPETVEVLSAAAIPVAGLTAWHAVKTVGRLQPGQIFFIWGGAGGLGTMAVQMAKHLGATVIAIAGSPERVKALKDLGVDYAFNRRTQDVPAEVQKVAPEGVDLLLDFVGTETFNRSFQMLRKGGTMLLCGIITGRETNLSIHQTYLKHLSIKGLYLGTLEEMREVVELIAAGTVRPYIGDILPLEHVGEAQRRMETGEFVGKLAIRVV